MNVKLLRLITKKYINGDFHDEKDKEKTFDNMKINKVAKYLCSCNVQDNEVDLPYNSALSLEDNILNMFDIVNEYEKKNLLFKAMVQKAYQYQLRSIEATHHRKNRGAKLFPTNWENLIAEQQMLIDFQQDIHKSFQSFEKFKNNFFKDLEENRLKSETSSS